MKGTSVRFVMLVATLVIGIMIGTVATPMLGGIFGGPNVPELTVDQTIASSTTVIHIVAVSPDDFTGVIGTATIEVLPGRGRILLNANPFIEPDTQESLAVAKAVAENYTGLSLANNDIVASFDLPLGNGSANLVGGPSAGAALAIATIAAITNATIRSDVAITGRITLNGTLGDVNGLLEKAQAAGEAGMKTFIIPAGQSDVSFYERVEEHESSDGFSVTRISYVPKELALDEYTQQWNMTTVEAATIADAVKYAIEPQ